MKFSKVFFAATLSASLWAGQVSASEYADRIVIWLQEQGFVGFEVKKTWLGRIKIEAYANGIEREIIINARTGEILRDYWEFEDDHGVSSSLNPVAVPEGMGNAAGVQPVLTVEDSHDESDNDDDVEDDPEDEKSIEEDDVGVEEVTEEEEEDDEDDEDDDDDDEDEEDD
jgi:hypothetical protein